MEMRPALGTQEEWDGFAAANGGGFLQSWGWAAFQEKLGRQVERMRLETSSGVIAQSVIVSHELPFGRRYLYVPRGPVLAREKRADAFASATDFLRTEAGGKADFVRIEPQWEEGAFDERKLEASGYRRGRAMQPVHSSLIDLTLSQDALLAAMHHKTRYNIRVAERHGVTVRDGGMGHIASDFATFWTLLSKTADRDAFRTHERGYYETMLGALAAKGGSGASAKLLFADYGGEAIAAMLVIDFNGVRVYLHGASDSEKRNVMAPYLLHWAAIREAKASGLRAYDFWGVSPLRRASEGQAATDDPSHPWAGISRFKRGFGGAEVSYAGAWELPVNRFWYTLYRTAKRLK